MKNVNALFGGGTLNTDFFKESLELSGAQKPNVLLAPTPKQTKDNFDIYAHKWSEELKKLGVNVKLLHEFDQEPDSDLIDWADILNVSGGNTDRMMQIWAECGLTHRVKAAAEIGQLVLCGVSAGAILGFTQGFSDSKSYTTPEDEPWDYIYVPGLEVITDTIVTPHFDQPDKSRTSNPEGRKGAYIATIDPHDKRRFLGIDNAAAVKIVDGHESVIRLRDGADVYVVTKHEDGSSIVEPFRN